MAENPSIIERPVIIHNGKAVIGRPIEKVIEFVKQSKK
jgi:arsenate reductase